MYENVSQITYNDDVVRSFKTVEIVKIHVSTLFNFHIRKKKSIQ
jgi:hypothetical protein